MIKTCEDINKIPHVRRIENCPKHELMAVVREIQKDSYRHDEVYGQYCTIEEYIDCPPGIVFEYLADPSSLLEWTYSLREVQPSSEPDVLLTLDKIGGENSETKIYIKTVSCAEAKTVDYHCAWDQNKKLWMIYLMRVVPAELVLNKPGSVVLWTNCRHPFYDKNPFPEDAPKTRPVWVGDLWNMFYAGHYIEMQNLKAILEHRYRNA